MKQRGPNGGHGVGHAVVLSFFILPIKSGLPSTERKQARL